MPTSTAPAVAGHRASHGGDPDVIPSEYGSSERLIRSDSQEESQRFWFPSVSQWWAELNKRNAFTVLILFYVNLINYMDRSTVAGMIDFIKNDPAFDVHSDKYLGLLQTAFVFCYMIFAPLFGYLGDRYSRKWIIGIGISFWCLATFVGSFMTNFWSFLFFRMLVGVGEASYSTIAPAIISDIFCKDARSRVLALFYFAIPVGTGFGYMTGAEIANAASDWRWGLRVTPFMGLVAVLLIVFFMVDPPRGESEGAHLAPDSNPMEEIHALRKNKSYVLSVIAFTCVTFSAGALMWWGPQFAFYGAKAACGNRAECNDLTLASISYRFGIVMTFAGILGVPFGSYVAQMLRRDVPNADPIVCGVTLLMSVPVLFVGFIMARYSTPWCYGLTFVAGLLLNSNWSIVSDITLYIVLPTRRSFASATQILVSHAFGDAMSPYLVGAIADWIRPALTPNHHIIPFPNSEDTVPDLSPRAPTPEDYDIEYRCLQYALFACCFFQALGAYFFLRMSFSILDDKREADRAIGVVEAREDANEATPVNLFADEPGSRRRNHPT